MKKRWLPRMWGEKVIRKNLVAYDKPMTREEGSRSQCSVLRQRKKWRNMTTIVD